MDKPSAAMKLTRWREYYGKVIFITLLGGYVVQAPFTSTLLLLVANMLSGAFAFMVNDISDAEDDSLDEVKRLRNPVSSGKISSLSAKILTFFVSVVSIAIYAYFNQVIFLFGLSGILVGFLYSYKRVRLKSKPVIDFTSHGYFLGLVYFLTAINLGSQLPQTTVLLWLGTPVYLSSVLGSISNQIRDYDVDRKAGLSNTAKYINFQKSNNLVSYLYVFLMGLFFFYILINQSLYGRIILVSFAAILILHHYINWFKYHKQVTYYPYNQQVMAFMGILIHLNLNHPIISVLLNLIN